MKKIALFSALALILAGFASCVEDKIYDVASISDIKNTVAYTEDDAVTVTAKVTALVEITKVELLYKAGTEAEKTVPMIGMTNDAGVYQGTIPAARSAQRSSITLKRAQTGTLNVLRRSPTPSVRFRSTTLAWL